MTEPTILIQFNPETLTPTAIFYNGVTETQTAKLREIANMMLVGLSDRMMRAPRHMAKLLVAAKRPFLKIRLRLLERKITPVYDQELSLKIDQIITRLEGESIP